MRTQYLSLDRYHDQFNERYSDKLTYQIYKDTEYGSDNSKKCMIKMMREVISDKMTARQRTVFLMRESEGRTAQEIAEILGISTATVYKHLRAADKICTECCRRFEMARTGSEYFDDISKKVRRVVISIHDPLIRAIAQDFYISGLCRGELIKKHDISRKKLEAILQKLANQITKAGIDKIEIKRLRRKARE